MKVPLAPPLVVDTSQVRLGSLYTIGIATVNVYGCQRLRALRETGIVARLQPVRELRRDNRLGIVSLRYLWRIHSVQVLESIGCLFSWYRM